MDNGYRRYIATLGCVLALGALTGCGLPRGELLDRTDPDNYNSDSGIDDTEGSLLGGEGGLVIGGERRRTLENGGGGGAGLSVNAYLWRATLDTLSFMPLNSADPFGGVIITDWYAPPESPGERFKMNVYILGRQLRADGIRITVFRQVRRAGAWVDATVDEATATGLENEVLTRARQLRIQTVGT
ncbi:MAG: DUF3576 domain-containing protein [Acetobacterales bacterium]